MNPEPLDLIPLWCFFLMTLIIGMLSVEVGYRVGKSRHARSPDEKDAPVAAMVGSILGLLAFMLAFTFSMAAARFDARRQAVLHEANAIGTTWLRARLLQSLNESIDLHSARIFAGLLSRIPLTIWFALFSLNGPGMAAVGYQAGLSATRRSPEMLSLTVAFASVLSLNVDLDRAHEGLLHVSQQPMINLYDTMQAAPK